MGSILNQAVKSKTTRTEVQGSKELSFIHKIWSIFFCRSIQSINNDQLFSTRPRLARSALKSKLDKSQLPPTDPSSARQAHEHPPNGGNTHRLSNPNVEVIGIGYMDEKSPAKQLFNDFIDERQPAINKPRAKLIKGNEIYVSRPYITVQ